jgi:carboxypeptidase PM20D1
MRSFIPALGLIGLSVAAQAQTVPPAREILMKSTAIPTVEGRGKVPELAAYYAGILKNAGYREDEVVFTPIGETGYLAATLKGRKSDKPILMLGHMDVVEAKASDWERDPFVPVEENGYLFGRGIEDNKYDVAMMIVTMARLKQQGFRPKQDVVLVLTGDEETRGITAKAAAQKYKHAAFALNGDGGGGVLSEDGKAEVISLQAGEKTYADFLVTMTDPGGHSSTPTATNPIYRMTRALARLDAYKFPAMQNELTRASFTARLADETGPTRAAIEAFLADPKDDKAADTLSANPGIVGQVRTTCIATEIEGGHAPNALPQSVKANINCRIFPGVSIADVQAKLTEVLAEPAMTIKAEGDPLASDASPLRDDVMKALKAAVAKRFPGTPVVPFMEAGATDSLFFRAVGVPSYGVASLAQKSKDRVPHGLNERVPAAGMDAAVAYWIDLVTALAK